MPNFYYRATDSSGKWVSGEINGDSHEQATAQLISQGLFVESLAETESHAPPMRSVASQQDLVELIEQLASLTRSGLPLPSGLRAAGQEVSSPSLRSTFFELADKIESGSNLEEALSSSNWRFPEHLRNLVLTGARSGRLADILGEYVRGANLGAELRRKFWWTLAYPIFALVVVLGLVGFVCSISVKAIDTLIVGLPDFGQRRSNSVESLAIMARFVTDHGLQMLIGALIVSVIVWATLRFAVGPARRSRLLCSVPVIGPILRFTSLTEFCHLLAMLIEADMPLPLAFEMAGSSVRDADVAEACGRMGRAVEDGATLSNAVKLWDSIPAGLGQLFQWSEDRQSLPSALHLAGEMFESRARSQSSFAGSVLSTLLLLLILWWIGFAIATLYLPLISLIGRLSG
jgi:type II secretory pathway component PulF